MHKSAYEIGAKFLQRYWTPGMKSIIEIGSLNVNGTLKDFKPEESNWIGVDLEPGDGVDVVIARASKIPFEDNTFDLVVATSIFEHDPIFWLTFNEMLRVVKPNGFVYVCSPSNGWVHRFPMDVYRFYPDAGIGLLEWGRREYPELELVESFISERNGDIWNDFCAVFSKTKNSQIEKIYLDTSCSNVWSEGKFLESTLVEATEDMRLIDKYSQEVLTLQNTDHVQLLENVKKDLLITELKLNQALENTVLLSSEIRSMQNSFSWKITKVLRKIKGILVK
jgi:SAM-dependent methyltransferase